MTPREIIALIWDELSKFQENADAEEQWAAGEFAGNVVERINQEQNILIQQLLSEKR